MMQVPEVEVPEVEVPEVDMAQSSRTDHGEAWVVDCALPDAPPNPGEVDAVMALVKQLAGVVERQAVEIVDLTQRWRELSASVGALAEGVRSAAATTAG